MIDNCSFTSFHLIFPFPSIFLSFIFLFLLPTLNVVVVMLTYCVSIVCLKVNKWNRELSTPKKKVFKERKENHEFHSAPHDFGKGRKNTQYGGYASGYNTKQRAGWITDDPEDFPRSNGWRSPSTPGNKRARISNYGDHSSISYSSRKSNRLDFYDSTHYGSVKYHHHHRFSASRFGNSSHAGRRNYEW